MHIFPPTLTIGDKEGFTPENDIFNRSALGRGLTNFVGHVTDPVVIAVDGQWGSGKTTFLKMWAGELRNAGVPVVYFDAFENDYMEDAFTAIAGEIVALAQEQDKSKTAAARAFVAKAIGAGKIILRGGLGLGVKLATAGVLEASDLKGIADDVASEARDVEDELLGELITKQREQKDMIQSFREALAKLPELLTRKKNEAKTPKGALVIIIDELDRCRPVFALQILERIKHFFSVHNVHFVLGAHMRQLKNSVIAAYGANIDAHNYLQKFIHLTLHLVDGPTSDRRGINRTYIEHLIRAMQLPQAKTLEYAADFFSHVADSRDLSLRTIERIMSTLAITLAFPQPTRLCPVTVLVGLCVIKNTDPELYVKAKRGTLFLDEARNALGFPFKPDDRAKAVVNIVNEDWTYFAHATDLPEQPKYGYLAQYQLTRAQVIPSVANGIIDRFSQT